MTKKTNDGLPTFQANRANQEKLLEAKTTDKDYLVFGAAAHKYELHPPVTTAQAKAFETTYGIQLPDCYRTFVLEVGNGGTSYQNSGAGPYYGIYPLGKQLDELADPSFLNKPCILFPEITDSFWKKLTDPLEDSMVSDEVYYTQLGKIFSGIMPLGSQGCAYLHGLILNGPYKGKVVNLEMSAEQKPSFAPDTTFLDWYERWLDEIISGALIKKSPSWFGYSPQ